MTTFHEANYWLKDRSDSGAGIRDDVRAAAAAIWRQARQATERALGDSADAGPLMELAASEASQYLDGLGRASASANSAAVLMKIFRRLLARYAARLRKLEPIGEAIEWQTWVPSWEDSVINQIFFNKLEHHLGEDSVRILSSRRHGYEWDELAAMFEVPVGELRSRFWREVSNAKAKLGIGAARGRKPTKKKSKKRGAAA